MRFDFSTEALDYQGRTLHEKLTEVFNYIRVDGSYSTKAILETNFSDIVKRHTGIKAELGIYNGNEMGENAYVFLPDMTKDHPFIKPYRFYINRPRGSQTAGQIAAEMLDNKSRGGVDLKAGKVTGFYSELPVNVMFTRSLISNENYTPEELAAICLHEMGHVFTYFQFIDSNCYGCLITMAVARDIAGIEDPQKREYLIKRAGTVLGVEYEYMDYVYFEPQSNGVLMLRDYMTSESLNGRNFTYDLRNMEQLADMFSVKHGAGKSQASALIKLYGTSGHSSSLSMFEHVIVEGSKFVLFMSAMIIFTAGALVLGPLAGLQLIGPMITLILLTTPGGSKMYDSPEARLKYMRNLLVQDLKKAKGNNELQTDILNQINQIDELAKNLSDKRTLGELFWESIPSPYKTMRQQELAAKNLEALLFNDLHVEAAKFSQLTR